VNYKALFFAFALLSCALLAVNGALLVQNRNLKLKAGLPGASFPQPGMRLAGIEGLAPDGNRVAIPFGAGGSKVLVLVFSPSCRICDQNWPIWSALIDSTSQRFYRVVYANTSPPLSSSLLKIGPFVLLDSTFTLV
jgi:hypothetical protein